MDTKTLLQNRANELLQQLIDLAGTQKGTKQAEADRLRAENIVRDLRATERAAQSADPPRGTKYAHYRQAKLAIEACLKERGMPMRARDVKQELLDNGYRQSIKSSDPGMDIQKSITIRVGTGKLKSFDDGETIGLPEWPDSFFRR